MKFLKHFSKKQLVKNILVLIFGLIVFLAFQSPIERIIEVTIIKYLLKHIDSIWYNDISLLLITGIIVFYAAYNFRRYKPNYNYIGASILVAFIYCLFRFEFGIKVSWELKSFFYVPWLMYSDLIFFFLLQYLMSLLPAKKTKKKDSAFFDDRPLFSTTNDATEKEKKEDLLGYSTYAKNLSEKILNSNFEKSFAIGINGKWGLGKTTFINLLKEEIKGDNVIEIDFNPWYSHNSKKIIEDFFDTLIEKLPDNSFTLKRSINMYSRKIADIKANYILEAIYQIVSVFSQDASAGALYEKINNILIGLNKKLVIYIDDVDRLDKDEIFEVIKLIRNTANFHNTFFIVAYDRNYIINSLKETKKHRTEFFLEKIFQLEISLPNFKKTVLRTVLAEKLKSKLPEKIHQEIDDIIVGSLRTGVPEYLDEWLENMRDVTRLANSLILNYGKLIGEVVFADYLRIELLRIKYPSIYELIFKETAKFFVKNTDDYSFRGFRYELAMMSNLDNNKKNSNDLKNSILYKHLKENLNEYNVSKNDVDKIIDLIHGIFPIKGSGLRLGERNHLSIVYPDNLYRYSAYSLFVEDLSENDFRESIQMDQKILNEKIKEWLDKGMESKVGKRFVEIRSFGSKEEYEKIIKAIFYFANLPSKFREKDQDIVRYDHYDLTNKIHVNKSNPNSKLYDNPDDLKEFIRSLLTYKEEGFVYQYSYMDFVNKNIAESFILDLKELENISIEYLEKNCKKQSKLDENLWFLYYCCKQTIQDKTVIPQKANNIFKNFALKKDIDQFLYDIIDFTPRMKKYKVSEAVVEIFGSWENFKKSIISKNNIKSNYLKEFLRFYDTFAATNYEKYVEFDFKEIPIEKKYQQR